MFDLSVVRHGKTSLNESLSAGEAAARHSTREQNFVVKMLEVAPEVGEAAHAGFQGDGIMLNGEGNGGLDHGRLAQGFQKRLDAAIDGEGEIVVNTRESGIARLKLDSDGGVATKSLHARAQSGSQPEVVNHRRMEIFGERLDLAESAFEEPMNLAQLRTDRARRPRAKHGNLDRERGERLADLIVEQTTDATALVSAAPSFGPAQGERIGRRRWRRVIAMAIAVRRIRGRVDVGELEDRRRSDGHLGEAGSFVRP